MLSDYPKVARKEDIRINDIKKMAATSWPLPTILKEESVATKSIGTPIVTNP